MVVWRLETFISASGLVGKQSLACMCLIVMIVWLNRKPFRSISRINVAGIPYIDDAMMCRE